MNVDNRYKNRRTGESGSTTDNRRSKLSLGRRDEDKKALIIHVIALSTIVAILSLLIILGLLKEYGIAL